MKFIERHDQQTAQGPLPNDTFEQLQLAFHERLRKDRVGLAVLSASLTSAGDDPAPVLQQLQAFAHRLRGAAAIFQAVEIRDAARDLEVAAHAAPGTVEDPAHDTVWSALSLLAAVLTTVTDSAASPLPI